MSVTPLGNGVQGIVNIFEQIVHVFNADRESNERVADTECCTLICRYCGMGHDGRVIHERFNAAERLSKREDADGFEEAA